MENTQEVTFVKVDGVVIKTTTTVTNQTINKTLLQTKLVMKQKQREALDTEIAQIQSEITEIDNL